MFQIRPLLGAVMLAAANAGATAQEIYLTCALMGPQNRDYRYSFAFDPAKGTLFWVEGSQEFKIFRNTATQLWASHKVKYRDFPHDETDFRLNRVSGSAEINYLRNPSPADVASCKRQGSSFSCEDSVVLSQYNEFGSCTVVDRVIR